MGFLMNSACSGWASGPAPLDVRARRFRCGRWKDLPEVAAREEAVRVLHPGGSADLWAWPHELEDLALGHVLLDCSPCGTAAFCSDRGQGNALGDKPVPLRAGRVERLDASEGRHCLRVCLELSPADSAVPVTTPRLGAAALLARMNDFFAEPGLWDGTGSFHRAGLFHPEKGLVRVAEDIGRHNCLDRLAGFCARQNHEPAEHALFISARITGSLYAKARRAGFALLVSRGAVTSAALTSAMAQGITLVGFCRPAEERLTVFCDSAGRVTT